jgi:hypothetical protein
MAKRLGISGKALALGLLAYFGARTYVSGEFAGLGASSYGTVCAAAFLAIGRYAALTGGSRKRTDAFVRFLLPGLVFLFGISSLRFLATVTAPLVLAHCASWLWSRRPHDWKGDLVLREMMVWAALGVAGWIVTRYVVMPKGFGPLAYQTLAANGLAAVWSDTLPALVLELVRFNPLGNAAGEFRLVSVAGATGVLSLAFYAACLWGLFAAHGTNFPERRTVYLFLIMSLSAMALAMLALLDAAAVKLRYLALLYVFPALAASFLSRDNQENRTCIARMFLALSCSFFALNSLQIARDFAIVEAANPSRVAVRRTPEIEDSLRRHGVQRAYSLYWQSAVETVLTDGRIEVWGVLGDMRPLRYLAGYRVYSPDSASHRTAYVMVDLPVIEGFEDMVQFAITDPSILEKAVSVEIIHDPEADVRIYYFARNPFVNPPGHDPAKDFSLAELAE